MFEKYKPQTINQLIGNKNVFQNIHDWLLNPTTKLCLISGRNGIGKTLSVEICLKELNIHPYYIDNIEENIDINILSSLNLFNTMKNCKNYIVVEEIDTISEKNIDEIVKNISKINVPIICISNTNYIPSFQNIKNIITNFKLYEPKVFEIINYLNPIIRENKINISNNNLHELINNLNCDIRSILNNLEIISYSKNICFNNSNENCFELKDNTSLNMFEIGKELFNMENDFEKKYKLFFLENSLMPLFIQENYVNNTIGKNIDNKLEYLSNSASFLSNVDIIERKVIEDNEWELQPHIALNTIRATENCNCKNMIKFPEFFKKKKQFDSYEYSSNSFRNYIPIQNINTINKLLNDKDLKENVKKVKEIKKIKKVKEVEEIKEDKKVKKVKKNDANVNNLISNNDDDEIVILKPLMMNKKRNANSNTNTNANANANTNANTNANANANANTNANANANANTNANANKEISKIEPSQIINQNKNIIDEDEDEEFIFEEIVINIDNKDFINCECGSKIKKSSKSSHLKSKKHLDFLKNKK